MRTFAKSSKMLEALSRIHPNIWRALCVLCALALGCVAVSNVAYVTTMPHDMPHHNVLRKIYALGAFALIGFLVDRSRLPGIRAVTGVAITVGIFSMLIELGQITIDGSTETLQQHTYDIVSGMAGGAFGAMLSTISMRSPLSRLGGIVTAVLIAIAILSYPWTYGSHL